MADQASLPTPLIPETENDLVSPEPTSPASSPAPKKAKKKANLSRAERDIKSEPVPNRSPCKVYVKGEAGKWVDNNTTIEGVKSKDFQVSNNKRVASRSGFHKTLALDALKLKTVCNDEVTVIIKQWSTDGNDRTVFSTSRKENIPIPAPSPSTSRAQSAIVSPNANDLRLSSPSKRKQLKKTARAFKEQLQKQRDQFCRKCDIRYRPSDDLDNPWVGCKGVSGKKCDTWVHASCTGWFPKDPLEVAAMPNWYCHKHRKIQIEKVQKQSKTRQVYNGPRVVKFIST